MSGKSGIRLLVMQGAIVIAIFALAACQTSKPMAQPSAQAQTSVPPPASQSPVEVPAPAPTPAPPPVPVAPGQSLIQTEALGFSPNAENGHTTIDFALLFSNTDSIKSWKAVISGEKGAQRTFAGDGSNPPSSILWDGKTDTGSLAPDGTYTAALSIDYGDAYTPVTVTSKPFILDAAPPAGSISISPPLFSPVDPSDRVTISIAAAPSPAKLDSWSMDIYDPGGNVFKTFGGKWPADRIEWDGKGIKGDLVVSAEDYPVEVKLRDEFGNVGVVKSTVSIDIIVIKQANGYRISNSRVYFKDFTADYRDVAPELAAQNVTRLDQLADKLRNSLATKSRSWGMR